MNIRIRKIRLYRLVASILLLCSIGLTSFCVVKVILAKPEKLVLDCIALSLAIAFAIGQIVLILASWKKESALLDIAFNTDNTVNKVALVIVLFGTALAVGLDILTLVVLFTRNNTLTVYCSMLIIMSIATYLFVNCLIYLAFTFIFRKKELSLEDYAK